MLMSQGNVGILFSNGLVGGMTTLALLLLFWPLISTVFSRIRASA
jgi:putative tricarboxylic transport membrane protein